MTENLPFKSSFASHKNAGNWSKDNPITPDKVRKGSEKEYNFECLNCHHKYISTPKIGGWCKYCNKARPMLCDDPSCKYCFEKSFASCEKSKYWSKGDGDITTTDF